MANRSFVSTLARAGLAASLSAGCSSPVPGTEAAPASKTGEVSQPIVGGTTCSTCQWPSAVHNPNGDDCTNTLVAPRLLMSAGHCFDSTTPSNNTGAVVQFGEGTQSSGPTATIDKCYLHPGYTGSEGLPSGTDISFCTLTQAVTDVPITPILMGCETAILKAGQSVVLAGFGATDANGAGAGTKRFVEVKIDSVNADGTVNLGDAQSGACFGDSGGPAFVKLADGTWRVFGSTSTGAGQSCVSASIYTLLHPIVPWVEATSGQDVTPCFDANGTWNPGPACGKFPTNPDGPPPSATWSNGCSTISVSATVSTTCGPNGSAMPDAGAGSDAGTDAGSSGGSSGSSSSGSSSGGSSGGRGESSSSGSGAGPSSGGRTDAGTAGAGAGASGDGYGGNAESSGCTLGARGAPARSGSGFALFGLVMALGSIARRSARRTGA